MVTNIKSFTNQSDRSIIAFNAENPGNSFWIKSLDTIPTDLWISYHTDRPLIMTTKKGLCRIVDQDWKVKGQWEGDPTAVVFLNGGSEGVGGEITVTVDGSGNIIMAKR